jgi:prepilin-type N-terminal cleavage/methylation domain-containing protein
MNPSPKLIATSERTTFSFGKRGPAGFTLVELLVSIVILVLVLSIVGVMIASMSQLIGDARKSLSSDDQARLAFTRMASDFSRMLTRKDVDIIFAKQSGSSTAGANDSIYFITEGSGSNVTTSYTSTTANLLTLAGYCIAPDAQGTKINTAVNSPLMDLIRLGHALTWDGVSASNTTPDNLVFVSFAAPVNASTTSALITGTTLDGHWGTANTSLGASLATLGSSPLTHRRRRVPITATTIPSPIRRSALSTASS